MGLISTFKRSLARTRVAQQATKLLLAGRGVEALHDVKSFIACDEILLSVLTNFKADLDTVHTIYHIFRGFIGDDIYRGISVPISAILDADTLSYMLRAHHGDVNKWDAIQLIQKHFHSSASIFMPERQYRIANRC